MIRCLKPLTSKKKEMEVNTLEGPRLQHLRSVYTARNITLLHLGKASPPMSVPNSRQTTSKRRKIHLLNQLRSERKRYPYRSIPLPPSKPHQESWTHKIG